MAEEQVTIPTYGYSKEEPRLFQLKPGRSLPKGYYLNPAMVPGSDAEKRHREDAEREGAPVPWDVSATADFHFVTGVTSSVPNQTDPDVEISWSDKGK